MVFFPVRIAQEAPPCIDGFLVPSTRCDKTSPPSSAATSSTPPAAPPDTPGASALLTPAAVIHWFLIQVFHGNTALNHVTLMAGRSFTASAFCQARTRLPLAVFRAVLRAVIHALVPDTQAHGRWLGLRPFLLDGSSFSMPDTPALQAHFGQPGNQAKGCGFPVAHILALFHAGTGLLLEVFAAPLRSHDMAGITAILPFLTTGDVLVADRGLCSFAHLALLISKGVHAVFRLH